MILCFQYFVSCLLYGYLWNLGQLTHFQVNSSSRCEEHLPNQLMYKKLELCGSQALLVLLPHTLA